MGAGLGVVVPVLFRAAGSTPGVSAAAGVAAVSTIGWFGFLAGPPAIGVTADPIGLRSSLAIVVVATLALALLAGSANPRRRRDFRGLIFEPGAVLSDMDGVLVDSWAAIERAWRRFAERHGLDPEVVLAASHGRPTIDVIRSVAPHLDAKAEAAAIEREQIADVEGLARCQGRVSSFNRCRRGGSRSSRLHRGRSRSRDYVPRGCGAGRPRDGGRGRERQAGPRRVSARRLPARRRSGTQRRARGRAGGSRRGSRGRDDRHRRADDELANRPSGGRTAVCRISGPCCRPRNRARLGRTDLYIVAVREARASTDEQPRRRRSDAASTARRYGPARGATVSGCALDATHFGCRHRSRRESKRAHACPHH